MFRKKITTDLLKSIRQCMINASVDAYIIPHEDAHCNEYLADCDKKVAYISGFTGSYGVAVVTHNKASLWTDGRYYEQALNELDGNWTLMKLGTVGTPTQAEWLNKEINSDSKVGFFKHQISMDFYNRLKNSLNPNRSLQMLDECLVSNIWQDRPLRITNPLMILSESFTGKSWHQKIDIIREKLQEENACGLFLSALDEIAWLFNLRGTDISHNPVFFSFCFVTAKEIHFFINTCVIADSPGLCDYLFGESNCLSKKHELKHHNYYNVESVLKELIVDLRKIWVDPRTCYGIVMAIPETKRHLLRSPVALLKAVKYPEEIEGMKLCNVHDSIALTQYFVWLEGQIERGLHISEAEGALELDRLRSKLPGFFSLSFDTISCSGRNGGLIHYHAVKGQDSLITSKEMYLCDSGAQYLTGTTDVTRTFHFGQPTAEEKLAYTLVLKGHINLASLVFPEGTPGSKIDSIARMALWKYGMDYRHGTGHGVGAFLNVHEGPYGISSSRQFVNEPGLVENMVLTIEPGFYKSKAYGIRIENDYFLTPARVNDNLTDSSVKFLKFEPLTLFPIQMKMVDYDLLTDSETEWINNYHLKAREKIVEVLGSKGLVAETRWLMRETEPVTKTKK